MHKKVMDYLRAVPSLEDPIVQKLRGKLHAGRSLAERAETLNFRDLIQARLQASTTLLDDPTPRERWDEANAWVTRKLGEGKTLSLTSIIELNKIITASDGKFRARRAYGEDYEFLSPDFFDEALPILENDILQEQEVFVRAGRVYIWVATVHPFDNGNGRTARLSADWILLQNGWLPLSFQNGYLSRVAQQLAERTRDITRSFATFLNGVETSYIAALGVDWDPTC